MCAEFESFGEVARGRVSAFPAIHEDELLYSIVARYGVLTGYNDARLANLDLFGSPFGHAALRLPSHLNALADRLPASLTLTGRDLLAKHTLLPYYCAYFSTEKRRRAECAALGEDTRIDRLVGADAQPLTPAPVLRFCPRCLDDMERRRVDLHWKRAHQLPIVVVCPEHGCDLHESTAGIRPNDRLLHAASRTSCPANAASVIPSGVDVDRPALLSLAEAASTLMKGDYPVYADRAAVLGLARAFRDLGYRRGSRINWRLLGPEIKRSVAALSHVFPGIDRPGRWTGSWLEHALAPERPARSDRILMAALLLARVDAVEPRFWAATDPSTGLPFLRLDDAL
ncbi:MAG TPA: TniQ family protein [Allosphingosinicella sp.]|jgi:hypothetical protein